MDEHVIEINMTKVRALATVLLHMTGNMGEAVGVVIGSLHMIATSQGDPEPMEKLRELMNNAISSWRVTDDARPN